jgi:protein SCO1/2
MALVAAALLAGAAALAGLRAASPGTAPLPAPPPSLATGSFATERLAVPDVTLIDQHAVPQSLKGPLTEGQIVVLNFSYTTCDTICPLGNVVLADLQDLLPPEAPVRLLSVTIDPSTDTMELMRDAADAFGAGPRWTWLTGAPDDVARLTAAFDADYANIALHDPMFLVGRISDGQFYRSLSMPSPHDLKQIIDGMSY